MPIRQRSGEWHYRFWVNRREYTASTHLAATERNRTAATRIEADARRLVLQGKEQSLKLEIVPFEDASKQYLVWADSEYREHPASAKRIRTASQACVSFSARRQLLR